MYGEGFDKQLTEEAMLLLFLSRKAAAEMLAEENMDVLATCVKKLRATRRLLHATKQKRQSC